MAPEENKNNLVVDLDGTLVMSDTLWEVYLQLFKQRPLAAIAVVAALLSGKAAFKKRVCEQASIQVDLLPYNESVVRYVRARQAGGSHIYLATASHQTVAQAVANHLGIFDEVFSSDGQVNLAGENKARLLTKHFGQKNFDYVGNARSDWPVWSVAGQAILVADSARLAAGLKRIVPVVQLPRNEAKPARGLVKALRLQQWIKNLLLFVPLLADHQFVWLATGRAVLAALAFSLTASAIYLLNDLFDLEADRQHPSKKFRPLAAGQLSVPAAVIAVAALLWLSLILAWLLPIKFTYLLVAYFALNLAYSLRLKQIALLDVMLLAVLYVMRVLAGGAATEITVSEWLMALILFLSLSGALLKRYVELDQLRRSDRAAAAGRGYVVDDRAMVGQFGIMSGYLSVLVLALYVNSDTVRELYSYPAVWWLNVLLLLYLISRVWLLAYRGQMENDPMLFLFRDKVNLVVVGFALLLFLVAI